MVIGYILYGLLAALMVEGMLEVLSLAVMRQVWLRLYPYLFVGYGDIQ